MHIFFSIARRGAGAADAATTAQPLLDAGQICIVRDPDDESEWQYLGNPEVAARTSLTEVVARFVRDCSAADGAIDRAHLQTARQVRDALLQAARQIDDALGPASGK